MIAFFLEGDAVIGQVVMPRQVTDHMTEPLQWQPCTCLFKQVFQADLVGGLRPAELPRDLIDAAFDRLP